MSKSSLKSLAIAATLAIGLSAALTGLAEARSGGAGGGGEVTLVPPNPPTIAVPNRGNTVSNQSTATLQCFGERPTRRRECHRFLGY